MKKKTVSVRRIGFLCNAYRLSPYGETAIAAGSTWLSGFV